MTPNPVGPAIDSESLQADVMRFMAIIAFCLIAILALVRNGEAPETPAPSIVKPAQAHEPVQAHQPEPRWHEPIEKPEAKTTRSTVQRVAPMPTLEPTPSAIQPIPIPAAKPIAEQVVATAPIQSAPEAAPIEKPAAPAAPPFSSQNVEDEGLSLRFASDGDFLRLIAKGDIRVFAYNESGVFALQPNYRFQRADAPGQVYELMEQTVPRLILDALERTESRAAPFTWAIAIPPAIRNQIENHIASVRSGQLVINRYGEVHHVARHRS